MIVFTTNLAVFADDPLPDCPVELQPDLAYKASGIFTNKAKNESSLTPLVTGFTLKNVAGTTVTITRFEVTRQKAGAGGVYADEAGTTRVMSPNPPSSDWTGAPYLYLPGNTSYKLRYHIEFKVKDNANNKEYRHIISPDSTSGPYTTLP